MNTSVSGFAGFKERFAACLLDLIIMWVLLAFLGNLLNEKPDHIFIGIVFSYKGTWAQCYDRVAFTLPFRNHPYIRAPSAKEYSRSGY